MRIFYKPLTLKSLLAPVMAMGMALASVSDAVAQIVTIGTPGGSGVTSTSGYPNPRPDQHLGTRQQYLYRASELRAAGMRAGNITEIGFYMNGGLSRNIGTYRIGGGTTTLTALTTAWVVPSTPTYWAYETISPAMGTPATTGWHMTTFDPTKPIKWNGTDNLIIEICTEQQDGLTNTNPVVSVMSPGFNASNSAGGAAAGACGSTSLTTQGTPTLRPITRFNHVPECIVPDSINIDNITAFEADLSWPASRSGAPFVRAYNWIYWQKGSPMPSTFNGTVPSMLNHDLEFLTPETCYYVRLQADCQFTGAATDTSVWILDSFCTIADCVPPAVTIDRITSTSAVASWPPVPTAYDYEYAVSILETPPTSGTKTTSTSVQLMGLIGSQVYNVFVRAYCSETPTSRWTRVPFQALKGLGFDDVANGFSLSAFPNPVKDVMTIQVINPAENASVMVTDLTGTLVQNLAIVGDKAEINMSGLNAGIYLVKYTDRLQSKMIKITKE
ncbi:MAG: T9SS type A sorting domain-containing protein [Sphingobacteriales bacterium]|nr:MAG: T9SS type A sorting domain-containing protein [Sphingobacteriales bacterium]